MTPDTRDLIDRLTNSVIQTAADERQLRHVLRDADEALRAEIAFYIDDSMASHPSHNVNVSFEKVQQYIGHQIKVADWHVRSAALETEWEQLQLTDGDLAALLLDEALDDLDDADTSSDA